MIDITNQRFGRLTALRLDARDKNGNKKWLCRCDCGNETLVLMDNLRRNHTKSCGCLHNEITGKINHTHGLTGTPEHMAWQAAKKRCGRKSSSDYKNYGGRGITISEEWKNSFETFIKDMGQRPSNKHTIERIDNNKGYSKENCRWATRTEQNRNRRNTVFATIDGTTRCVTEWCEIFEISCHTVRSRMRMGMSPYNAIQYNRAGG